MSMKWTQGADEHLKLLMIRHTSIENIAKRFGTTEEEIIKRWDRIREIAREAVKPKPAEPPPLANHVQQAFLDMSLYHNQLGKKMQTFGQLVTNSLHPEELEQVLRDVFNQPRQPGDTIIQKLARGLDQRCVVMLKPPPPDVPA